jgi:hypothetical protein
MIRWKGIQNVSRSHFDFFFLSMVSSQGSQYIVFRLQAACKNQRRRWQCLRLLAAY